MLEIIKKTKTQFTNLSNSLNYSDEDVSEISQNESFLKNFESFEKLLEVLINLRAEDLFNEVKAIILSEFERLNNEIKIYLKSKSKLCSTYALFNSFSQTALLIISDLSRKVEYYSLTIHSLVDKLNNFFVQFVENTKKTSNDSFNKCLIFVEKYIQIKGIFMKNFCLDKESNKPLDKNENNLFCYKKFCSFGRYFFNNLLSLIEANLYPEIEINDNVFKETYKIFKIKILQGHHRFLYTKTQITNKTTLLNKHFRTFFNSKLSNWKFSLSTNEIKTEICRICETKFKFNELILHVYYCKEKKVLLKRLSEINNKVTQTLKDLKTHRE